MLDPYHAKSIKWLFHKHEVLRDREILDQRYFLERGTNSKVVGKLHPEPRNFLAKDRDRTGVRPDEAAEYLDDRRLTGAVFAEQRMEPPPSAIPRSTASSAVVGP